MAQVNDLMFEKLRAAGYTGSLSDMLRAYLSFLGFATVTELYQSNGFTSGAKSDFALTYWSGTIQTVP